MKYKILQTTSSTGLSHLRGVDAEVIRWFSTKFDIVLELAPVDLVANYSIHQPD